MTNRFASLGRGAPTQRELLVLGAFFENPDADLSGADMYDAAYGPDPAPLHPRVKCHMVERVFRKLRDKGLIRRLPLRRRMSIPANQRTSMCDVYVVNLEGLDYYRKYRHLLHTRRKNPCRL